jgi:undecaprenyl-diphosphatase
VNDARASDGAPATSSRWWIARPALIGIGIAVPCLLAFLELAEDFAASPRIERFDATVTTAVQAWRSPALTAFFVAITSLANAGVVWAVATVLVLVLVFARRWSSVGLVLLAVGFGTLFGSVVKLEVARPRPPLANMLVPLPSGYSFPSGHALAGLELYGVLAFLAVRELRSRWLRVLVVSAAALVVALIGLSRVYLGVHWPSDVLASWLLGGAWLALLCGAYASWERLASTPATRGPRSAQPGGDAVRSGTQ